MHRVIRRGLCVLLSFVLFVGCISASAVDFQYASKARSEKEAIAYIESFANDFPEDDGVYTVAEKVPLESLSDTKSYVLFVLAPSGYAIYDETSGIVEEMFLHREVPYNLDTRAEYYYGGPLNYFVKTGTEYRNIKDNSLISSEMIASISRTEANIAATRANTKAAISSTARALPSRTNNKYMSNASYFTNYLGSNFGSNNANNILAICLTIMFGFYDYVINDAYVNSTYELGTGTNPAFYQYIVEALEYSLSIMKATEISNRHLLLQGIYTHAARYNNGGVSIVESRVYRNVDDNRPTIIAMRASLAPIDVLSTAGVAYGYREELVGPELVSLSYYAHTGEYPTGNTSAVGAFSYDWFEFSMCFNNDPESENTGF